ncbi:DNA polymerase kappa [Microthyrium microscopicum]|uniref:DNA polymerase kappa n=1 Tax=Microthyrium microscopicum TaxID=703497 RepID=A0A6A6U0C3_9PEZI|nr:DNA polymerase kappa [Microthyrium microscopicum]
MAESLEIESPSKKPQEPLKNHPKDVPENENDQHSLKYRLLGPSLTKAGQDAVDQSKISEIIYEASKGSKFFANEQARDRALTEKIKHILAKRDQLLKQNLSHDIRKADEYLASLEADRDISQVIVHVDCDAFYAAVEELDRPDLKNVPFAVGKGVLTTCNYEARKYGCRSAMAGFVALKLCPQLVFLPLNFDKYIAKAQETRSVFAKYDPRYQSASLDEAYLNITSYCEEHSLTPWDAVQQLRAEVVAHAKITVSAGIAANAKLAKIASNQKKPNGQFMIESNREAIMSFMDDLPVRKVNGVGRVLERQLDAIGITTCDTIHAHRGLLSPLFGTKAATFLLQTYLGLGRTAVAPAEESERKSVGTERTFAETSGKSVLREKLNHLAVELECDLKRNEVKGRTLVLKIKLHTYEVVSRQTVTPFPVQRAVDLEKFATPLLRRLEGEYPNMRLRLMGLRCTGLVSTAKTEVDFFGTKREKKEGPKVDSEGWEIWPEAEFECAEEEERLAEVEEMEALSQEYEASREKMDQAVETSEPKVKTPERPAEEESWECPVCGRRQIGGERVMNEHIDTCLSRRTIVDVVKEQKEQETTPRLKSQPANVIRKKRGRRKESGDVGTRNVRQKSLFD